MRTPWLSFLIIPLIFWGCRGGYSFTGGDVGAAKTIQIEFFPNYAPLVNPNLSQVFTDEVRQIFLNRTSLEQVNRDGDMKVEGAIVDYSVQVQSALASEQAAQNRLTVRVNIVFTNTLDPDKSFEQQFSRYRDYSTEQSLQDVEDTYIREICEELAQDIFNRALVNW